MNFVEILDKKLEELDKKKREARGDRDGHYPSEASTCLRKLYLKWKKYPETNPIEGKDLLKLVIGDKIHELIVDILKDSNVELVKELDFKYFYPELKNPIRGRVDIIYLDKDSNKLHAIEIKTISGNGVYKLIKDNKPQIEHIMQASVYLWCTDLEQITLLYIARDKSFKTQYTIKKDENKKIYLNNVLVEEVNFEKYLARLIDFEAYIVSNVIPKQEFNVCFVDGVIKEKFQHNKVEYKSDWQCMYCQYLDLCWELEKNNFKEGKYFGREKIC